MARRVLPERATPHSVLVYDFVGASSSGTVLAEEPREVPRCLFDGSRKKVRLANGEEATTDGSLFTRPEYGAVPIGSKVETPDGPRAVVRVQHWNATPAPELYELTLGPWVER